MTETTPTPSLPIWHARSFWVQIAMLISAVIALLGDDTLAGVIREKMPDTRMPKLLA